MIGWIHQPSRGPWILLAVGIYIYAWECMIRSMEDMGEAWKSDIWDRKRDLSSEEEKKRCEMIGTPGTAAFFCGLALHCKLCSGPMQSSSPRLASSKREGRERVQESVRGGTCAVGIRELDARGLMKCCARDGIEAAMS